jgi:RNA polymerase sigma-70 factor, ECF subfamily
MTVDEGRVVEQIRGGEPEAFQELVERYKKKIYYLAYDMTGNHQDAEDVSQEVFLKAFRFIKDFRGESKLSSWLYRITMNVCIDQKRKRGPTLISLHRDAEREGEMEIEDSFSPSPARMVEADAIQKDIERALLNLTPRERAVFTLRHYNDLMVKEIAEILKISDGTVKSLLFRAVRRLRKVLSGYSGDFAGSRNENEMS